MTTAEFDSEMHVELIQHEASDYMVVHAARVSTLGDRVAEFEAQNNWDGPVPKADAGLINFLMKNRHGTPFEHGMFTFRVCVPIFVMRELHRHRVGFSYNEESGRYKQLDAHFYMPAEHRALTQVGKPGHYVYEPGSLSQIEQTHLEIWDVCNHAWDAYARMLDDGIAKEVARMVLPVNTYSSCYITCNPRSLMHFLSLRTKDEFSTFPSYPMQEIEWMARMMETEFARLMPVTCEAFCKNGRVAP